MADDLASQQPAGSSILNELDKQVVKGPAEALRANIQAVHIDNEQSGQLSPSHTPGRGRK